MPEYVQYRLPIEGEYEGKIDSFGEIRQSQSKAELFFIPVGVAAKGIDLHFIVSGHLTAMQMLKQAESHWIGKPVTLEVKHIEREEQVCLAVRVVKGIHDA